MTAERFEGIEKRSVNRGKYTGTNKPQTENQRIEGAPPSYAAGYNV